MTACQSDGEMVGKMAGATECEDEGTLVQCNDFAMTGASPLLPE